MGGGAAQPILDLGKPVALDREHVGLVLLDLAGLLLAGEFRGEGGQLLMTGFPQRAQLVEHQCTESGLRITKELAERIELLLNADGRTLLLLEPVVQEMNFVLEVGVGLFQAGTVLEELHEPLFLRTLTLASHQETQLFDQSPTPHPVDACGKPRRMPLELMPALGAVFQPFI